MTQNERLQLFQRSLEGVYRLEVRNPGYPPLESIHNQLLYLIALESGQAVNPENLKKINIGVLTAREVERRSDETANLLYLVATEVDAMMVERRIPQE